MKVRQETPILPKTSSKTETQIKVDERINLADILDVNDSVLDMFKDVNPGQKTKEDKSSGQLVHGEDDDLLPFT